MKKWRWLLVVLLLGAACQKSLAQAQQIEQLVLDIEKLSQLKKILQDMKDGYDILTQGYNAVRDISEGNFNLHKAFLDGLLAVSPAVKNYIKVAQIINNQLTLVSEYKSTFSLLKSSGQFNPDEILYIANVYSHLLDASLNNISDLTTVLTAGSLRMSDAERLAAIDRLDRDMTEKVSFLRSFNNQTAMLALQRAREQNSIQGMQHMYNQP